MPDAGVPMNALINPYGVVYPWLIEIPFYNSAIAENFTKDFTN